MSNLEKLMEGLGGVMVRNRPEEIREEILAMIACPFEEGLDCDEQVDEYEGYPAAAQCAECKRRWLEAPARR